MLRDGQPWPGWRRSWRARRCPSERSRGLPCRDAWGGRGKPERAFALRAARGEPRLISIEPLDTKPELGDHDENIDFATAAGIVGREVADRVRDLTLELYGRAADHARQRGIILADTKFEFGLVDGEIVLIDEVLTPDSSRFWPADDYEPGRAQRSFDKQYVRDWLETLDWDKTPPGPELPDEIVQRTRSRYVEAYELLTGLPFSDWT